MGAPGSGAATASPDAMATSQSTRHNDWLTLVAGMVVGLLLARRALVRPFRPNSAQQTWPRNAAHYLAPDYLPRLSAAFLGLRRFVVADDSMLPQLRAGDRLLVLPLPRRGARPGDVVIVSDPEIAGAWIVKRVAAVLGNERLELRGDNTGRSRDSRAFGPVAPSRVVGRAVWRYLPGDRRGWVR